MNSGFAPFVLKSVDMKISRHKLTYSLKRYLFLLFFIGAMMARPAYALVSVSSVTLTPSTVPGGSYATATITFSAPLDYAAAAIYLTSSNPTVAAVPASFSGVNGDTTEKFIIDVAPLQGTSNQTVTITATYGGVPCSAVLTVTPDYTTTARAPSADAYVQNGTGYHDQNFGTSTSLIVKTPNPPVAITRVSYIKFDLTDVTVAPTRALLKLYFSSAPTMADRSLSVNIYSLPAVSNSWTETGITWDNAPNLDRTSIVDTGGTPLGTTPVLLQPGMTAVDMTSFVQAHLGQTGTLQIVATIMSQDQNGVNFYSKEAGVSIAPSLTLSFNAPTLFAQVISSSQVTLTWTDPTTNRDGYIIERKDGSTGTWTANNSVEGAINGKVDVYLQGGTNYSYRIRGFTGTNYTVYSNVATVITNTGDTIPTWGYLGAYPTSGTSIRLYWPVISNATQFKIFRTLSTGQYNYSQPIAIIAGSAHFFDDSNLTNGQKYYYVVRITTSDNKQADSEEDNTSPNTNAIPWNGTASQIFLKAYQLASSHITDGELAIDVGNLSVIAPDSLVYQSGANTALPPNGSIDYLDGIMTLDGFTTVMPVLETTSLLTVANRKKNGGCVRRAVSTSKVNNQEVLGIRGNFYVPNKIDNNGFQYYNFPSFQNAGKTKAAVSGHCYIGTYDPEPGVMIDAGVQYNIANDPDPGLPDRWRVFLRINDGRGTNGDGYDNDLNWKKYSPHPWVSSNTSAFALGYNIYQRMIINRDVDAVDFYVNIGDAFGVFYQKIIVSAFRDSSNLQNGKTFNKPRMKRVVSTDEVPDYLLQGKTLTQFNNPLIDPFPGCVKDGTYMTNITWSGGELNVLGQWAQWSQIDTSKQDYNYWSKYLNFSGPITLSPPGGRPDQETITIIH